MPWAIFVVLLDLPCHYAYLSNFRYREVQIYLMLSHLQIEYYNNFTHLSSHVLILVLFVLKGTVTPKSPQQK